MKGLLKELLDLGVPISEFERRSTVSYPTLKRVDQGDPKVRFTTLAKVRRTYEALQKELKSSPVITRQTGS